MKLIKKLISVTMICVTLVSVTACGKTDRDEEAKKLGIETLSIFASSARISVAIILLSISFSHLTLSYDYCPADSRNNDNWVEYHSFNTMQLAMAIAMRMGYPETEVKGIAAAGLMHDIGKGKDDFDPEDDADFLN